MEWSIAINDMLRDEITKLNYTMMPPGFHGDVRAIRVMQESLARVLDALGEQSAAAQGLNKVITTADKLRAAPTHTLYLLKDPAALGGKGEAIGLLKVGRKRLFLFDAHAQVVETEPLCVLDFFVTGDRQRHGHGKRLFDYMLQDTGASAEQLAIDGPSAKMERFLCKNYAVERLIRQNNNFAVSPRFFDSPSAHRGPRSPAELPAAVGRFAAPKPTSAIATVIHGGGTAYYQDDGSVLSELSLEGDAPAPPPEPEPVLEREMPVPTAPELEPEDEEASPERPNSLALGEGTPDAGSPAAGGEGPASRRDSQLTERGYFDIKFYHNKLW